MIVSQTLLQEVSTRLEKLVNSGIKVKNVEIPADLAEVRFTHGKSRYSVSTTTGDLTATPDNNGTKARRLAKKLQWAA